MNLANAKAKSKGKSKPLKRKAKVRISKERGLHPRLAKAALSVPLTFAFAFLLLPYLRQALFVRAETALIVVEGRAEAFGQLDLDLSFGGRAGPEH